LNIRDLIPPIFTNLFEPKKDGSWFFVINSSRSSWNKLDYINAFSEIPEVNAILNARGNARSNGRFKVVDAAGTEYPNEPILERLKKPNWFQGQKEFMKQTSLFRDIFGNEYLYFLTPVGFSIEKLKALYTLPPNLTSCEYDSKLPFFVWGADETPEGIKYFYLTEDGQKKELDYSQIVHLNDNRVKIKSMNDKNLLKGDSKMDALKPAINNIRMAYESRGIILKHRGANGALVTKSKDGVGQTVPLKSGEKSDLESKYNGYGTLEGQSQLLISSSDLAWVQMGTNNPMNLGLFQETEEDFNKILDGYNTPAELFVRKAGSTYENQRQARKGWYSDSIIPEANEWCGGISAKVYPDGKKSLILDYLHMPIFQEDMKQRGDALTSMVNALSKALADGVISIEEYKEELKVLGLGKQK